MAQYKIKKFFKDMGLLQRDCGGGGQCPSNPGHIQWEVRRVFMMTMTPGGTCEHQPLCVPTPVSVEGQRGPVTSSWPHGCKGQPELHSSCQIGTGETSTTYTALLSDLLSNVFSSERPLFTREAPPHSHICPATLIP